MKRLLCLTAAFALAGTAAFGQSPNKVHDYYFRAGMGADTDAVGLIDMITRALEKSRSLHRQDAPDDATIEVEAPIKFNKEADGRVTITFEVTPPAGSGSRPYTASCKITQLDRCADAVVLRTERIARELESFEGMALPPGF
jgi:hypothetical protein